MVKLTKAQQSMIEVIRNLNGKPLGGIALSPPKKRVVNNLIKKGLLATGAVILTEHSVVKLKHN